MPQQSIALPCTAHWDEDVYRLEVTDPVLAYNPVTGEDGPANRQALALGNRTLHLKGVLSRAHTEGRHALTNADFTSETRIPEKALALAWGTGDLSRALAGTRGLAEGLKARADDLADVSLSFSGAMRKLIPLSRAYTRPRNACELFSENVSLRSFASTELLGEIKGDDSLDLASTTGVVAGSTYVVCDLDGGRAEEATVASVLTDRRIRCTQRLAHTRSAGRFAASSLVPGPSGATANKGFLYVSGEVGVLENSPSGRLVFCRGQGAITGHAEYRLSGSSLWLAAPGPQSRTWPDGSVDDVYELPSGRMQLRLTYTSAAPFVAHYLLVLPRAAVVWIEDVRQPEVTQAVKQGTTLTVSGGAYGTLYGYGRAGAEARVSANPNMLGDVATAKAAGDTGQVVLELAPALAAAPRLYVQLRYRDAAGNLSRWSAAAPVQE